MSTGHGWDWDYEYDDDYAACEGTPAVRLFIFDADSGDIIDCLGGIECESLSVSDHGNVNLSPDDIDRLDVIAHEMAAGGVS